jgi:transcriptional/translational regulatory protein YebC/TACO1
VLTDNKNRAAAEIRAVLTKHGGHLASAKHLFHRKGQIIIPKEQIGEDELINVVLDAGAEDVITHDETYEIITDPHQFEPVHKAVEDKKLKPVSAEVAWVALTPVPIADDKTAKAILSLVDALEDHEDVQNVYSSADIPDAIMEKLQAAAA